MALHDQEGAAVTDTGSVSSALGALGAASPDSVSGYRMIRAVIESEGALSAAEKAIIVAVVASTHADADLAAAEIARGRSVGLSDDQIVAAASALLLSRGQSACARLLKAAGELSPEGPRPPASEAAPRDYFLGYYQADALPPRLAVLAEHAEPVFEAYHRMHHAALRSRPEFAKLAELVLCAIQAADLQTDYVTVHADGARRVGAGEQEILEAVVCAMTVAGVGAWASGSGALKLNA